MKNKLLNTFLVIIFGFTAFAQPGSIDLSFNISDSGVSYGENTGTNYAINTASTEVFTSSIQSDGKIIIGGRFTSYNGVITNGIARLNIDGTLDNTFVTGTGTSGAAVYTTSIQSDGKIIIGGDFGTFNGKWVAGIARLNTNGTLDDTFVTGTGFNDYVSTTSIQSDGKIIIGGSFTTFNGIARNRIARLNSNGTLDTNFSPTTGADKDVNTTSIQSDGKIIIGGLFTTYNGISRIRIARLNSNGTLDTTYNPIIDANAVYTTAIQSDGKTIFGGSYIDYLGRKRIRIDRLNIDGTLDSNFKQAIDDYQFNQIGDNSLQTISIKSDGKIIVTGWFKQKAVVTRLNTDGLFEIQETLPGMARTASIQSDGKIFIGGRLHTVRLNPDLTRDAFNLETARGANGTIRTTSIQSDGKIIIGGTFTNYNGSFRGGIARINTDGTNDTSFIPQSVDSNVFTTSIQSDGKIIIGGYRNLSSWPRIARLNANGMLDTTFNVGTGFDNIVYTTAIQSDGKIIVGGAFSSYNGTTKYRIARLNTNGTLDTTFIGYAPFILRTISIQSDGKIIIGGHDSSDKYKGYILRLNSNGSVDTTFKEPSIINGSVRTDFTGVYTTFIQSDGKIIFGGDFDRFNVYDLRPLQQGIGRLNTDGTIDSTFEAQCLDAIIYDTSIDSDGRIIVGGSFTTFNGSAINRIVRLNSNGTLDSTFNQGEIGANGAIYTTAIQSDGKIIVGGDLTSYNNFGKNRIARINGGNALGTDRFDENILNVYPNPSNGYFTIHFDDLITTKTIEVYTILGQKVYSKPLTENVSTLNLSAQPHGVYLYKLFGEEREVKSGKLLIK
jgi:uncharacterized delta-60 repeat protein